ncbi:DUF1049 domain-containing protein [Wohlfahrtiimonas chitiniclastica]|uniref:lipopolysaccharide assembly protein LapA domain-containing protein n=1 Tax=Wohlfahrtiimonas chitiniclastica TaxID=400946 RepID=UPI001BD02BE0|nr:lipopolysaccharide assembly protein LapA domain-containing protein [Wohlfahrtiimonas chitiniclastica]MBS7827250.1 DUF1049 domain-containing protein [Wohlfahrtiimonas chitiniclastica]
MKKIIKWINFVVFLVFLTLIFFVLYLNRGIEVHFDYLIGDAILTLPAVISIIFLSGAVCGIIVSLLLSLGSFGESFRQRRELKAAKKSLKKLQEEKAL